MFSDRRSLYVVPNRLVEVPQLERLVATLGHLADDAGGPAGDNAETRNDHVRRDDGAIEDAGVVLDDGHLSDDDALPNMNMTADAGGLDNGALPNVDVVSHSQG